MAHPVERAIIKHNFESQSSNQNLSQFLSRLAESENFGGKVLANRFVIQGFNVMSFCKIFVSFSTVAHMEPSQ